MDSIHINVPPEFSPKQLETPTFQPTGKIAQIQNLNAQPHHQFRSTGQRFKEKQQEDQFHSKGSGHQAEDQSFNRNEGLSSGHGRSQATTHIERGTANSAQGLGQTSINGVDVGCAQGFEGCTLHDIHLHNNSIIMGNSFQQSQFSTQFPNPKTLLDYYFANQNLSENIHQQNQFENIHVQNQNLNQFVNIHEQNPNQNQFVNLHDQDQNQFIDTDEHKPNHFVNIHDQNKGGTQ